MWSDLHAARSFTPSTSKQERASPHGTPPLLHSPGSEYLRKCIEWLGSCTDSTQLSTNAQCHKLATHSEVQCQYQALLWQGCVWQVGDMLMFDPVLVISTAGSSISTKCVSQTNRSFEYHRSSASPGRRPIVRVRGVIQKMYEVIQPSQFVVGHPSRHGGMSPDPLPVAFGACRLLRPGQAFMEMMKADGTVEKVAFRRLCCKVASPPGVGMLALAEGERFPPTEARAEDTFVGQLLQCLLCHADTWRQSEFGQTIWLHCIEPNLRLLNCVKSKTDERHQVDPHPVNPFGVGVGAWAHSLHHEVLTLVASDFRLLWYQPDAPEKTCSDGVSLSTYNTTTTCCFCGRHIHQVSQAQYCFQFASGGQVHPPRTFSADHDCYRLIRRIRHLLKTVCSLRSKLTRQMSHSISWSSCLHSPRVLRFVKESAVSLGEDMKELGYDR